VFPHRLLTFPVHTHTHSAPFGLPFPLAFSSDLPLPLFVPSNHSSLHLHPFALFHSSCTPLSLLSLSNSFIHSSPSPLPPNTHLTASCQLSPPSLPRAHLSQICSHDSSSLPHILHIFPSSLSQYFLSPTSFPNRNLATLAHLFSFHPFFIYSGIPFPFITLYHLLYLELSILSHLSFSLAFPSLSLPTLHFTLLRFLLVRYSFQPPPLLSLSFRKTPIFLFPTPIVLFPFWLSLSHLFPTPPRYFTSLSLS